MYVDASGIVHGLRRCVPLRRASDDVVEWCLGAAPAWPAREGVLLATTVEALAPIAGRLACAPGDARVGFVIGERDALAHLDELRRLRPQLIASRLVLALGDAGLAYAAVQDLRSQLFDLVLLDPVLTRQAAHDLAAQTIAGR